LLKSEGKNIDISKIKHLVELMKENKQNSKELNKNLRNFFYLKNQLSSDHTQNEISTLKTEYIDLSEEFKVYKQKLLDVIKMIGKYEIKKDEDEEDEKDRKNDEINIEKKLKQTEETITGKIEYLVQCVEKLNENLKKLKKNEVALPKK
jgi:chromosome segregation ATPase